MIRRMLYAISSCTLIFFTCFIAFAAADTQNNSRALSIKKNLNPENRTALVIGNSNYKVSPLKNPVNDAKKIAETLKKLDFYVIKAFDASQKEMKKKISKFGKKIAKGGTGLFFYAGHGMQVKGRNYLIPIGAKIQSEEEVEYESVDTGRVLAQMASAGNGMNIVILDACRDNPFARSFRSGVKGLAHMDAPSGTIIAYSTAPGQVAADGSGDNSVFTGELVKNMNQPGVKIEDVFKRVRKTVRGATKNRQTPWESSSLEGDFYFIPQSESQAAGKARAVVETSIEGVWKKEGRKKLVVKIADGKGIVVSGGEKYKLPGQYVLKNIKKKGDGYTADRALFKKGKVYKWIKTDLSINGNILMETGDGFKGKKLFYTKVSK